MNRRTEKLMELEEARLEEQMFKELEAEMAKSKISKGEVSSMRYADIKFLLTYIHVKEPTIREWIRLKKIPFLKVGKLIRFDLQQIDQWLKEKAVDN